MDFDPSIEVKEGRDVYPPFDDTYLLLQALELGRGSSFLEIGTGTGLIALHASRTCGTVATDVNPAAVRLCKLNAERNDVPLHVLRTDLFNGLRARFDTIAFNPPYLPETRSGGWLERSWNGGEDGNEVILRFLEQALDHMAPGGRIYLLLSSHNVAALRRARQLYDLRPLLRKPLFFEEIAVYELRRPGAHLSHKL